MKKIIHDVNFKNRTFSLVLGKKKVGFYLTNRLVKMFFPYLKKGVLVDFEIAERSKRIGNCKYIQVAHFNQIVSLMPYYIHYDLFKLRDDMRDMLLSNDYFVFLDFEMTMPGYRESKFSPEIIQVGYAVAKANSKIVHQDGYYVLPKDKQRLTTRTKRFLNLDQTTFFKEAVPYDEFYEKLKKIIKKYNPKFVVWGKNDVSALSESYALHQKEVLTNNMGFVDLLKLHKDYFNLANDIGLFKAYKSYYDVSFKQAHDAKDDAIITKYVFDAFLDYIKNSD